MIAKPEHRSKHVFKANVSTTVTQMSINDIPQYRQFYVLVVTLTILYTGGGGGGGRGRRLRRGGREGVKGRRRVKGGNVECSN